MTTPEAPSRKRRGPARPPLPDVAVIDVPCPTCEARGGVPCHSDGRVLKTLHSSRREWRDELIERASGDTGAARWHRVQLRAGKHPAKRGASGTEAAYIRMKRRGEPVDPATLDAARARWRERNAKYREAVSALRFVNPCPVCGADAGQPCVTTTGEPTNRRHGARL